MRCNEEYINLLININKEKSIYAEKEEIVFSEEESKIQFMTEKLKKIQIWMVIYCIICAIILWPINILLEYYNKPSWIVYVIYAFVIGLFVFIGFEIAFKIKLKVLNEEKEKHKEANTDIRKKILDYNNKISSLVISVLTLNEHFNELATINNEQELFKKWDQYTKEMNMAINKKYNYHPTYSEHQEYYRDYEKYLESQKENNE